MNAGGRGYGKVHKGFTLVELLVVIAIIALLAGLVVGGAKIAVSNMRKARVEGEREQLITAIETYHKKKGFYPPDNPTDLSCVQNQLFYELTGSSPVLTAGTPTAFLATVSQEKLTTNQLTTLFGITGFLNADNSENSAVNCFPGLKANQHQLVTNGVSTQPFSVLGVQGAPGPQELPPLTAGTGGGLINPWHYNSSHPTNNVNSFDLWMDVKYSGKVNRINNWSKDPQIVN